MFQLINCLMRRFFSKIYSGVANDVADKTDQIPEVFPFPETLTEVRIASLTAKNFPEGFPRTVAIAGKEMNLQGESIELMLNLIRRRQFRHQFAIDLFRINIKR